MAASVNPKVVTRAWASDKFDTPNGIGIPDSANVAVDFVGAYGG